jgi:hypothetical protein
MLRTVAVPTLKNIDPAFAKKKIPVKDDRRLWSIQKIIF